MSEIGCACAQQPSLWTTVENPVDKPVSQIHDTMSLNYITSSLVSDTQQATLDALDIITARLDAVEHDISTIVGILNSPLPPELVIQRLRQLRDEL